MRQLRLSDQTGLPKLQFVVPTGNFGDVLAGYYAKRMGLPMEQLGIGTNENDILARFWKTGDYEKGTSAPVTTDGPTAPVLGSSDGQQASERVKATLSPAMDIMVSSNFERLLWYLTYESEGNSRPKACETVNGWMGKVKSDGRVTIPVAAVELARKDFVAERISDEEVRSCNWCSIYWAATDFRGNRHWRPSKTTSPDQPPTLSTHTQQSGLPPLPSYPPNPHPSQSPSR